MLANMERLEDIMSENSRISEDNSATTQQLAAGMQETTIGTAKMSDSGGNPKWYHGVLSPGCAPPERFPDPAGKAC